LIGNPLILLTGLLLFFESGNEVTCGAWLTTHMVKGVGLSASAGAFYLSGLWGGVILGRLAAPWMLRRLDEARLVQASGVSSFLALAFLLAFPGPRLAAFSAIWLGISFSAVFPAVLGLAARRFRDVSGTAFGILMGIALTGGMLFPWLTGHVVQVSDTTRGLMIPAAGFVVVLAIQTLLRRRYFAGTGSTRG
jgi:fucose permease